MATVGKHIKRLRAARGLTQEQLAEKLFVTRQAVSAWETGKALPDLDMLERIAAALDADPVEVIYGPRPGPNLKALRRRWMLTGGGAVLALTLAAALLVSSGAWGTWRSGISYQLIDPGYGLTYSEIPGSYTVTLDLTDLWANAGRVLYEDDLGCRILVDQVDGQDGRYRVHFRAYGVCTPAGGTLVSGCQTTPVGKRAYTSMQNAEMTVAAGGRDWSCAIAGNTGLNWKNGNMFSFHLSPHLTPDQAADAGAFSLEGVEQVTVTVSGLSAMTTYRT